MLNLVNAIKVSADVFFYNLGAPTERRPDDHPNGGPLQQWARQFGIGRTTGIDLPGEERDAALAALARGATSSSPSATAPPARSGTRTGTTSAHKLKG